MMTPAEEARAVDEVARRLATRFPQISSDTVSRAVKHAHAEFANSRIRDFVPLFVERNARDHLRAAGSR
jgi:hypothetical protein